MQPLLLLLSLLSLSLSLSLLLLLLLLLQIACFYIEQSQKSSFTLKTPFTTLKQFDNINSWFHRRLSTNKDFIHGILQVPKQHLLQRPAHLPKTRTDRAAPSFREGFTAELAGFERGVDPGKFCLELGDYDADESEGLTLATITRMVVMMTVRQWRDEDNDVGGRSIKCDPSDFFVTSMASWCNDPLHSQKALTTTHIHEPPQYPQM